MDDVSSLLVVVEENDFCCVERIRGDTACFDGSMMDDATFRIDISLVLLFLIIAGDAE